MKVRDANMDLMRITAMLLVMLFHDNFYSIAVEEGSITGFPSSHIFGFALMKCISMVCVNMFILISGWYGIRPTLKKFFEMTFQVWFFSIPIYLAICFTYDDIQFSSIIFLRLLSLWGYWFIPSYLLLYICAPILNSFVEHTSKKTFSLVLTSYYLLMFLVGWLQHAPYFNNGCSPLLFFALYLTARYLRLYPCRLSNMKIQQVAIVYLVVLLATTGICTFFTVSHHQNLADLMGNYISPFNILLSVLLLIIFSKLNIRSSMVNKIGISCFSAYLLHNSPYFYLKIYYPIGCYSFHLESKLLGLLLIIGLIAALFTISILLDKLRIAIWLRIEKSLSKSRFMRRWEA